MRYCIFIQIKIAPLLASLLIITVATPKILHSQAPGIEWQKCLGGKLNDQATCIIQSSDSGYVIAGVTYSNDGDVSGVHGTTKYSDAWIVKLSSSGSIEWQKCLGGSGYDAANSIIQTFDGGYVIAGSVGSLDGDVSGYRGGSSDAWVVKLSPSGSMMWQKCIGGTREEYFFSLVQTPDSGFAAVGSTYSTDGDVIMHLGAGDAWIVRMDSSANIIWQKYYPDAFVRSITTTSDGGFAIAGGGSSDTINGTPTGFHDSFYSDVWVAKLSSQGNMEWEKCLGGTGSDVGSSVIETADKGFAIAASSVSNDGDLTDLNETAPFYNTWIIKLKPSENIPTVEWSKCFGGSSTEEAFSIIESRNKDLVVAADASSTDLDVSGNHGGGDAWIFDINQASTFKWGSCFGGRGSEIANSIRQCIDGGYIFVGNTTTRDNGDVNGSHFGSDHDIWVVKLNAPLSVSNSFFNDISLVTFPNPASKSVWLAFDLPNSSPVEISIYNVMGVWMSDIQKSEYEAGHHETPIDLGGLAEGTYFVRLKTGEVIQTSSFQIMR